jgi:hypothetical protein
LTQFGAGSRAVEPISSANGARPRMPMWLLERPSLRLRRTVNNRLNDQSLTRHRCGRAISHEATDTGQRCFRLRTLVLAGIKMQSHLSDWLARVIASVSQPLVNPQVEQTVAQSVAYCCLWQLHRPWRRVRAPRCRSARLECGLQWDLPWIPLRSLLHRRQQRK